MREIMSAGAGAFYGAVSCGGAAGAVCHIMTGRTDLAVVAPLGLLGAALFGAVALRVERMIQSHR